MGGAEGVVDEDGGAARRPRAASRRRVVLLFLGMEAHVLEQQHAAVAEGRDGLRHLGADAVGGDGDGPAQQLGEAPATGAG